MRGNVYEEYKGLIHDSNRTGVRATCPDCHFAIAHDAPEGDVGPQDIILKK